jgi:4'-phosphopantetheinyl transferase
MISLFWALPQAITPREEAVCLLRLDDGERSRAARFRVAADRTAYVAGHALLRSALAGRGRSYFSLSHVRTCVACAVSDEGAVGIDVEDVRRIVLDENMLELSCTALEIDRLRAAPSVQRPRAFAQLWTLKEALFKTGGEYAERLFPDVDLQSAAASFYLTTLTPTTEHVIGLAAAGGDRFEIRQIDGAALAG